MEARGSNAELNAELSTARPAGTEGEGGAIICILTGEGAGAQRGAVACRGLTGSAWPNLDRCLGYNRQVRVSSLPSGC